MKSYKRTLGKMTAVLAAIEALAFLVIYIPNYVIEVDSIALTYVVQFLNRFLSFLLPLLSATYIFSTATVLPKSNVIVALQLSLTTLIYSIPYNYLVYLAQGNDSIESLSISLLLSAINVPAFALITLLLHAVMLIATVNVGKKIYIDKLPPAYRQRTPKDMRLQARRSVIENLSVHLREGAIFDITSPTVFGIFAASFVQFAVYLVIELIDIVAFLIEYVGDYRNDEIFYIVFVLVFIFLELFAAHAICYLQRGILTRDTQTQPTHKENDDGNNDEAMGE